ncbi:hypothetical protein DMUE_2468 [Dictyocoela muelleri]|nr:hypothetical protein DMUE_2468 [Dictyocoela muelleri]
MAKNKIDNSLRDLIIENYDNVITPKIISKTFKLPVSTIKTIISIYKKESRVTNKTVGGAHNIKVSDEIKNYLEDKLNQNCTLSLEQLKEFINNKFSIRLCLSTINDSLKSYILLLNKQK